MRVTLFSLLFISTIVGVHALVINEVMSNPTGDDSGREWIEVYNNGDSDVDLTGLTVSIKGGSSIVTTPLSGGAILHPHSYAIIASVVSGATKFSQDYPAYSGPLLKSAISLVNTGVTSLEIKLQGATADTLSSYTAAKEGYTYSLINGSFVTGNPTPGEVNSEYITSQPDATTTATVGTQATLPQSSPSADIILFLPAEKTVVAGAPSYFSVRSQNHEGKPIENISYTWSFGDGGERTGSSTIYRYFYPGFYVAQVEGSNGSILGTGRMTVRVVAPDISISSIGQGKYGPYIDITNPSAYDLDISDWKLSIDGAIFPFPKNTLIRSGVTHFSGVAMGFASTTVSSSTLIKVLFPTMDEVLRISQSLGEKAVISPTSTTSRSLVSLAKKVSYSYPVTYLKSMSSQNQASTATTTSKVVASSSIKTYFNNKDTRIVNFIKWFLR